MIQSKFWIEEKGWNCDIKENIKKQQEAAFAAPKVLTAATDKLAFCNYFVFVLKYL